MDIFTRDINEETYEEFKRISKEKYFRTASAQIRLLITEFVEQEKKVE